jgi:hypothetical protein
MDLGAVAERFEAENLDFLELEQRHLSGETGELRIGVSPCCVRLTQL